MLGMTSPMVKNEIGYPFRDITPFNVVSFLFLIHRRRDLELPRPFKSYLREAKKFIEEVGEENVLKLFKQAIEQWEYNFGFEYMRRLHGKQDSTKIGEERSRGF